MNRRGFISALAAAIGGAATGAAGFDILKGAGRLWRKQNDGPLYLVGMTLSIDGFDTGVEIEAVEYTTVWQRDENGKWHVELDRKVVAPRLPDEFRGGPQLSANRIELRNGWYRVKENGLVCTS